MGVRQADDYPVSDWGFIDATQNAASSCWQRPSNQNVGPDPPATHQSTSETRSLAAEQDRILAWIFRSDVRPSISELARDQKVQGVVAAVMCIADENNSLNTNKHITESTSGRRSRPSLVVGASQRKASGSVENILRALQRHGHWDTLPTVHVRTTFVPPHLLPAVHDHLLRITLSPRTT